MYMYTEITIEIFNGEKNHVIKFKTKKQESEKVMKMIVDVLEMILRKWEIKSK